MSESLSAKRELDHATLWRSMRLLLDRVSDVLDGDAVLDDALDILVDILGADRGMVLLAATDGTSTVIRARGQAGALSPVEREEISRTVIRRALDSGRFVAWDPMTAGGASESVATLGIIAALAAPLYGASARREGQTRGVLYVDFRDPMKHVGQSHIEFFLSSAVLLGAVLEQNQSLQTTRAHLREAQAHCMESRQTPPLTDLLGPTSLGPIRREVETSVNGESPILILGESGTGKTLLAQAIAEASGRRPIVRAVLGSSDDLNTITSELFGHERGAFSGATSKRVGIVEFANHGTLILDEILNLPSHAQQLLLDFTQFGTYRPLGYERPEPKRATVRIIAATNGDLDAAIRDGRFRSDLFYRLAAVTLHIPPLRERREDIPALAEGYLRRTDPTRAWTLSFPLRRLLVSEAIEWGGNVRQLERMIQRARERAQARDPNVTALGPEHFEIREMDRSSIPGPPATPHIEIDPANLAGSWQKLLGDRARIEQLEEETIRTALAKAGGVVAHAARELGIARTTLSSRIDALGIQRKGK